MDNFVQVFMNGEALLLKMALDVKEHGSVESLPKLEGKRMFLNLKPKIKN